MMATVSKTKNTSGQESCGNAGAVESVESQKQASPSFHSPLEISPTTGEIPTFPQLRREAGGWKSGKPKAGFPLSHRHESLISRNQKPGPRAGFALRPAAGASRRTKSQRVIVVDREK
jgi:hypothetical protein